MKSRQILTSDRFILLGASRGLGWATYQNLFQRFKNQEFLLVSRRIKQKGLSISDKTHLIEQDFSKGYCDEKFVQQLQDFQATHLIYFAGGGPYGPFSQKKWSDHQWAFETTFLYPARLVHLILSDPARWSSLRQVIIIGSAIAENRPDINAASYSAAKHALKGLVDTLVLEKEASLNGLSAEVRLFSPGYMQTDLLPINSQPRQNGVAENPLDVAKKLIAMIEKND